MVNRYHCDDNCLLWSNLVEHLFLAHDQEPVRQFGIHIDWDAILAIDLWAYVPVRSNTTDRSISGLLTEPEIAFRYKSWLFKTSRRLLWRVHIDANALRRWILDHLWRWPSLVQSADFTKLRRHSTTFLYSECYLIRFSSVTAHLRWVHCRTRVVSDDLHHIHCQYRYRWVPRLWIGYNPACVLRSGLWFTYWDSDW